MLTLRPRVTSRLRIALGTFVAIDAQTEDPAVAERGIAAAFEAICTVDRLMHPTRPGTDLDLLAACPPGTSLTVHPWTFEVLALCRKLNACSRGIFDPCLHTAVGRMRDLELIDEHEVRPLAPLCIDLGGIAKGYAVDRAVDALRDAGCDGGLVNAGGDLAVFGARARTIVCRGLDGQSHSIELRDAALATSEVDEPSRPAEHRGHYHGLDRARAAFGKVTVIAARAAIADALTKCLLFADPILRLQMLAAFGARQLVH